MHEIYQKQVSILIIIYINCIVFLSLSNVGVVLSFCYVAQHLDSFLASQFYTRSRPPPTSPHETDENLVVDQVDRVIASFR